MENEETEYKEDDGPDYCGLWEHGFFSEKVDGKQKRVAHKIKLSVFKKTDGYCRDYLTRRGETFRNYYCAYREIKVSYKDAPTDEDLEEIAEKALKDLGGKWVCDGVIFDTKEEADKISEGNDFLVWQIPEKFPVLKRYWKLSLGMIYGQEYLKERGLAPRMIEQRRNPWKKKEIINVDYEIVDGLKESCYVRAKKIHDAYECKEGSYGTWDVDYAYEKIEGTRTKKKTAYEVTIYVTKSIKGGGNRWNGEYLSTDRTFMIPLKYEREEVEEFAHQALAELRGKWVCENIIAGSKEEADKMSGGYDFLVWQIPEDLLMVSKKEIEEAMDTFSRYDNIRKLVEGDKEPER